MPSFFFVKPDLYQLSESEKLLLNCIQELGDSHSKKIGQTAKLRNKPDWVVKINSVTITDFGLPIMHVSAHSYKGEAVDTTKVKLSSMFLVPSSCFEGELDFDC